MKPRSMLIFLLLLAIAIIIGLICGFVEDCFWKKNFPQASVQTEMRMWE